MFKTHLLFSVLIGIVFSLFLKPENIFLFLFLVILFGVLPDIDHHKSWIGRKFKGLSFLLKFVFKHRGIFHSIFPILMLYLVFLYHGLVEAAVAMAVGYFGHLLIDGLTLNGINFLHPVSNFRIKGFIRTGSLFEKGFLILLLLGIGYTLRILAI